jgi:eukaryotic-like serine/threonine-protein kinase
MNHAQIGERTWVDERAESFERDWKRGGDRPRIEDYLADLAAPKRTRLAEELVRVERELRQSAGEAPTPEEYHRRLPDDRAAVDAAFGIDDRVGSPSAEAPVTAAHSLLFGIFALQNNFIDRETLLAAFNAWVADKSQSLGQILLGRGALSPARHGLLAELVQEHLDQYGQDPERSLAVLTIVRSVRDKLQDLPDLDLQASLLALRLATTDGGGDEQGESTASWEEESAATDGEGRFRIIRFHDRGALGEVFVARDQQLHRVVALKRIKLGHLADEDKRARFVVEAEITGRLEHPGIVPVYGLGTFDDGRPFYAMRFIRGDNLKAAIDQFHQAAHKAREPGQRALALQKLLRRFLDVCNALDYAHSRGVLHRDLKPGNIMLGKFGETLVVDWGLAKSAGRPERVPTSATLDDRTLVPQSRSDLRETQLGARLGTPAYMSPEQAAGQIDKLGPASDVYSLGATLYCVLTGRAPFNDHDLADLLRKVERGDFPPPRTLQRWIDPALEAICLKAMATDTSQRYVTPRALADDLEHWLADEPVSAWREPIRRRLRRFGRRHRMLMTGAAATVLVAAGALAVANVLVARERDRAERNLAFARQVVDEMYTGTAGGLEDEKFMDDYQREILEKALRFYERFALPQNHDREARLEAARAGLRVAVIRSQLGQTAAAEQAARQVLSVVTELASSLPGETVSRETLAEAHRRLGVVLQLEDRFPEAQRELEEAITVSEALAREQPRVARYKSILARAHGRLADALRDQAREGDARTEYLRAMELNERLVKENPDEADYQHDLADNLALCASLMSGASGFRGDGLAEAQRSVAILETLARHQPQATKHQNCLANSLGQLGLILAGANRFPEAEKAQKRGVAVLEKLAIDHPQNTNIAANLGSAYYQTQNTALLMGDFQSALDWGARALPLLRSAQRRDPNDLSRALRWLVIALAEQGEALMRLGRHGDALPVYEEILELTRNQQKSALYRAFHALTKARLGDLSRLALLAGEIRDTIRLGATADTYAENYGYYMIYFDAACVHAALVTIDLEGRQAPPEERQRLAQQDRERALELLDKARANDEFKSMIRLDDLRREKLLDPLRSHPRFRLLLMDLAFPHDPFRP